MTLFSFNFPGLMGLGPASKTYAVKSKNKPIYLIKRLKILQMNYIMSLRAVIKESRESSCRQLFKEKINFLFI